MNTLFSNVSAAFSGAFREAAREAASMANDMHAIIMADVGEVNKRTVEEGNNHDDDDPAETSMPHFISVRPNKAKRSRSSAKKDPCDTLEEETSAEQPTGSKKEVKRSPSIFAKFKTKFSRKTQPTIPNTVTIIKETSACEREKKETNTQPTSIAREKTSACERKEEVETNTNQPNGSNTEIKGSPATLAKLMTRLDKKTKRIAKLEQLLSSAKEAEMETRKTIDALAAKYRDVLDESVGGDDNDHINVKQTHDDQIPDDQTGLCSTFDDLSDDDSDRSEYDHYEADEDVINLALDGTSSQFNSTSRQLARTSRKRDQLDSTAREISEAFNQAIFMDQ